MKLETFIKTKPDGIRLGQYFFNCFFHALGCETNLHRDTQKLYNTTNDNLATVIIKQIMLDYQWEELPDLIKNDQGVVIVKGRNQFKSNPELIYGMVSDHMEFTKPIRPGELFRINFKKLDTYQPTA